MKPMVRKFNSHAEADEADWIWRRGLSPQQRLDILLDLLAAQRGTDEAANRFERVYRIVKRGRR